MADIPKVSSAVRLVEQIKADPKINLDNETLLAIQEKVTNIISSKTRPLETDASIYRIVVGCLGFVICVSTVGILVVFYNNPYSGDNVPQILTALTSASVGALAGLLAPTSGNS